MGDYSDRCPAVVSQRHTCMLPKAARKVTLIGKPRG